jgi:DNA-binding GntR family transcriptional regulator
MQIIDREDHQKLYLQLFEILKKKIEGGEWALGSQIPTEEELCKMFGVSRATVRTAVLELVRHGYLKRQQGKGTYIHKNIVSEGLTMLTNFREIPLEEGLKIITNVLARTVMMPVDDLDKIFDVSGDKHIIYIKRLHAVEGKPVLLQESYIPYHICPLLLEEQIAQESLFDLFEKKYGIKITRINNYFDAASVNTDEARLLDISEESSRIVLKQYCYSAETLAMYTRSMKQTGMFPFFIELERKTV